VRRYRERGASRRTDGDGRATAARRRLLAGHADTLAGVIDAADAAVEEAEAPRTESTAVTGPLSAALDERGLPGRLLDALADAVDAVGESLPHDPVPEPPYFTVTSRGPVLRATLPAGRLVVVVGVFGVERDGERRYVRVGRTPAAVLRVEFHGPAGRTVAGVDDGTGDVVTTDGDGDTSEDAAGDRETTISDDAATTADGESGHDADASGGAA